MLCGTLLQTVRMIAFCILLVNECAEDGYLFCVGKNHDTIACCAGALPALVREMQWPDGLLLEAVSTLKHIVSTGSFGCLRC